jgi:hypothetical protein
MVMNLPATIKTEAIEKLNQAVDSVLTEKDADKFHKAYVIAKAAGDLKQALTKEYMAPIMELQNNRLGFKTDKKDGYDPETVKNCLIEAVLTGVQPFGNQFNIIAGNCYITKEGFGHLLANYPGLSYEIIPQLPRISQDKSSAAIKMEISWKLNGVENKREIDFPIRVNSFMGVDAIIGKATRKARAWLFNSLTGVEVGDGDVSDVNAEIVGSQPLKKTKEDIERDRISAMIDDCKTVAELQKISSHVPEQLLDKFTVKMDELKAAK